jgi:hypothetical protein
MRLTGVGGPKLFEIEIVNDLELSTLVKVKILPYAYELSLTHPLNEKDDPGLRSWLVLFVAVLPSSTMPLFMNPVA